MNQIILPPGHKYEVVLKLEDLKVLSSTLMPNGHPLLMFQLVNFPCPGPSCAHEHEISSVGSQEEYAWLERVFMEKRQGEVKCHACGSDLIVRCALSANITRGPNRKQRRAQTKTHH